MGSVGLGLGLGLGECGIWTRDLTSVHLRGEGHGVSDGNACYIAWCLGDLYSM